MAKDSHGNAPSEDFFNTSNPYVAAYGEFLGHRLVRVDKFDKRKVVWFFEGENAVETENLFYESDCKYYSDCYKTVKDRGFSKGE